MLTYDSKIYIAGMTGMVGSNLRDCLARRGYSNVIGGGSKDLNLINQNSVNAFFDKEKPETVVLLAGKVGGILANTTQPAEFIYENLVIEANVIHAAYRVGVKKLIFLASSSVYPRECDQPMAEAQLLSGPLEPTNEPYSVAKIVGIKLCEFYYRSYGANFFTLIPCNLYGPYDHFGREDSHVLAALIHRFHTAKAEKVPSVTLWGSGTVRREFLYSGDLAEAIHFALTSIEAEQIYSRSVSAVNVGTGTDITIRDLSVLVAKITGYENAVTFDRSKPDGVKRKLLDERLLTSLGWRATMSLEEGLKKTYKWFCENYYGGEA
jgi:GDP-L-fucose synthase